MISYWKRKSKQEHTCTHFIILGHQWILNLPSYQILSILHSVILCVHIGGTVPMDDNLINKLLFACKIMWYLQDNLKEDTFPWQWWDASCLHSHPVPEPGWCDQAKP